MGLNSAKLPLSLFSLACKLIFNKPSHLTVTDNELRIMKVIKEVQFLTITQVAILNKSYLNVYQIPQKVFHSTKIHKQVICAAQKYCQKVVCAKLITHC